MTLSVKLSNFNSFNSTYLKKSFNSFFLKSKESIDFFKLPLSLKVCSRTRQCSAWFCWIIKLGQDEFNLDWFINFANCSFIFLGDLIFSSLLPCWPIESLQGHPGQSGIKWMKFWISSYEFKNCFWLSACSPD